VLFQPREFSYGARDVDPRHVGRLATLIKNLGELDPPIVVKLGKRWVVVDGHHRIAAYQQQRWPDQIKCLWFRGTAQEAADESQRQNSKIKLEVPLADKQEAAWKRTLTDPKGGVWSRAYLSRLCGIAEGTIALMRRVAQRYYDKDDQSDWAQTFRREVGRISECSWSTARLAFANVTQARQVGEGGNADEGPPVESGLQLG
jgi:ParB-like nuclease domain